MLKFIAFTVANAILMENPSQSLDDIIKKSAPHATQYLPAQEVELHKRWLRNLTLAVA